MEAIIFGGLALLAWGWLTWAFARMVAELLRDEEL